MSLKNAVLPLLLCLVLTLPACGGGERRKKDSIILLHGYAHGMPRTEVARKAVTDICPDDAESLCRRQPASLFKIQWEQRFRFKNDRLVAIELKHRNTKEVQALIDKWLDSGHRYMPTLVKSDGRELDILAMVKQYGRETTRQSVQHFLKGTPLNATTTYIYGDFARKQTLLTGAKNHATVLARAPHDFILIEESINEESITLTFWAPAADKK